MTPVLTHYPVKVQIKGENIMCMQKLPTLPDKKIRQNKEDFKNFIEQKNKKQKRK